MNINKRIYSGGRVKWRARYPDPARGGKSQIEKQFDTKREAELWLTDQRVAIRRGDHVDPRHSDRAFRESVEDWEATWIELEPRTQLSYRSILRRHVLPRWADARISAISPHGVQAWINELARERHSGTVRHIYFVMRSILRLAVERRYLVSNPCDSVRVPRAAAVTSGTHVILTAEEVTVLAEAIDPRYRVLIYTAAYGGLRAGELGALTRKDVDLLHGTLHVNRALKDIAGRLEFGPTKTGRPRVVGLPSFLIGLLSEHIDSLSDDNDALLFTAPRGGPLRHGTFYRRQFRPLVSRPYCGSCCRPLVGFSSICSDCGERGDFLLPPAKRSLRFHDLRHTCASLLISVNAHPKAIQEHLGHRNIQTTFNVYGHLLPSARIALAAALDSVFEGDEPPTGRTNSILPLGRPSSSAI